MQSILRTSVIFITVFIISIGCNAQDKADNSYKVSKDITWASPEGFDLTMDIYTPNSGKKSYPVLVIFHGGGWLINDKSIMDQMSDYVVTHGEYVVCNVNYRLLGDLNNTVTMNDIVNDAFGAVLWVKDNIAKYGGNPKKLAVTGDSAGGHLAEMVIVAGQTLNSTGFDKAPFGFIPTYLPNGKTPEQVAQENGLEVQAGLISYGAFNIYSSALGGFEKPSNIFWQLGKAQPRSIFGGDINAKDNPDMYKAVSPFYYISKKEDVQLPPQLFTVGSNDNVTTPKSVKNYVEKLKAAGQPTEFWEYEGRPHAFLDSGSNQYLGIKFEKDAPEALDIMIKFLNKIFY